MRMYEIFNLCLHCPSMVNPNAYRDVKMVLTEHVENCESKYTLEYNSESYNEKGQLIKTEQALHIYDDYDEAKEQWQSHVMLETML